MGAVAAGAQVGAATASVVVATVIANPADTIVRTRNSRWMHGNVGFMQGSVRAPASTTRQRCIHVVVGRARWVRAYDHADGAVEVHVVPGPSQEHPQPV